MAAEARAKKRRQQIRNAVIVVVIFGAIIGIVFLVTGNGGKKPVSAASGNSTSTTVAGKSATAKAQAAANELAVKAGCPASPSTRVNTQTYPAAPAMTIDTNKLYSATVKTTAGSFNVSLYAKAAPAIVNNFVFLTDKGFYHCVTFDRVIPHFMDQTGDPTGTTAGNVGYTLPSQ